MSDISAHPVDLRSHGKAPLLLYHIIFAVLFSFGLVAFLIARIFGRPTESGIVTAAKQAAHASAGYAVMH